MDALQKFAQPLITTSTAIGKLVDNRSPFFPHLTSASEFAQALGWIFVSPTPIGHVQGQLEAADFYLNKILVSQKGPDASDHKLFVQSIKAALKEMQPYIKAHHTTGLVWNAKVCHLAPFLTIAFVWQMFLDSCIGRFIFSTSWILCFWQGKDLSEFSSGTPKPVTAGPPVPAGPPVAGPGPVIAGPPVGPPAAAAVPPPPVAAPPAAVPEAPAGGAAGMSSVFASINAGHSALTSGLRHVTKDMKSKNLPPAESVTPKAPAAPAPKPVAAVAASSAPKPEPKMYEKQGKWFVVRLAHHEPIQFFWCSLSLVVAFSLSAIMIAGVLHRGPGDHPGGPAEREAERVHLQVHQHAGDRAVQVQGHLPRFVLLSLILFLLLRASSQL